MTMRWLAASLLLVLAGCSSNGVPSAASSAPVEAGGRTPTTATGGSQSPSASPLPGVLVERNCGSDGSEGSGGCNAAFALDGKHYFISCEPVSPGSVADEAMGGGVLYGQQVTVRRVTAGTNTGQVAVGPLNDFCGPNAVAPGYYAVAPPGAP